MAIADRIDSIRNRIRSAIANPRDRVRSIMDMAGWENVTTGHGTTRDKRGGARIKPVNVSMDHATFDDIYAGDDIAAKIADKPAEDMIRKWISLTVTPPEDEERVSEGATTATEIADAVLQDLNRLASKTKLREALTWSRVYGGALVFVAADEGAGDSTDLSQPLDASRIRSIEYLEVFDRFEVNIASRYEDSNPEDLKHLDKLGQPKTYQIQTSEPGRSQHDQQEIHETRFLRFEGPLTPRRRRTRNDGWPDSIYIRLEEILSDFGISWGSVANLLSDFAQAVFKMKGLGEAIASDEGNLVLQRMLIMDTCRSTVRAVPIDADDEDFGRQATPVTGLSELLELFMFRMSSAARMPATVLFGRSPAGMNATGESDLSIWYDQVESMQEADLRPQLSRLISLTMSAAEGPTRGMVPESWEFSFNPLWQMSQDEETKSRKAQAEADAIYIENQVLTPDEVAESRFGGETYSFETQLDTEEREAAQIEPPPGEE